MVDNVRLPTTVEKGARGGPRFKTSIQVALAGVEQRIGEWDIARCEFDIGYGVRSKADLDSIISIYRTRHGPLYPFRFKDWTDYSATTQSLGDGDGSTTQFQLVKKYNDAIIEVSRTIQLPVQNTVLVYVGGVLQTENAHYTVNYSTGVITFLSAPSDSSPGGAVTATFEFDVPVRFAEDALDVIALVGGGDDLLGEIRGIRLIEVLSE